MSKLVFKIILGLFLPIFCYLLFLWISFMMGCNENTIILYSFIGLCIGFIADFILGRIWKSNIYEIAEWLLVVIYGFYSICLFGFFMGVPVFQVFLGMLAGYYWSKRLLFLTKPKETFKSEIKRISGFSAFIMTIICLCSATIALIDNYTIANLTGMLHLPFEMTKTHLVLLIVLGGVFLVYAQYWLTMKVMVKTLKYK